MPTAHTPPSPPIASLDPVAALYRRYAVALLAVTLLLGFWMRAMLVWPRFAAPIPFQHLVHAHSHVGFFGWLVLGVAAAIVPRDGPVGRAVALRRIAHALAIASVAALVAFAWQGYGPISIGVSAVHVALWIALVRQLWPVTHRDVAERPWLRIALLGLCAAGASTLVPGVLKARGIESGWIHDLGIELFLDLFIFGWVIAASVGIAYEIVRPPRSSGMARALFAIGIVPSACLYVTDPPAPAVVWLGRAGAALVGAALLLVARDLLARRHAALTTLASLALGLVGAVQVIASAGVGATLLHGRPIVLAFVHLALLGVATPVLLAAAPTTRRFGHAAAIALFAGGLVMMLAALVAMGWPWLYALAARTGLGIMRLLVAACVGGGCAAAGALLIAYAPCRRAHAAAIPLLTPEASFP